MSQDIEYDPIINTEKTYISIARPSLGIEEKNAVAECIDNNWISQGKKVQEFEDLVSNLCNKKYTSACNSGTTALHLALALLDLKEDDEVIIPDFSMIALANAVLMTGATPVFADSSRRNESYYSCGNVDLDTIKECVTNKTKAVIVVHTYGSPVHDISAISHYCKQNNLVLIEDCAEAHFAYIGSDKVGSFADLTVYSFYSNKNITTGEGGSISTNDPNQKDRLDRIRMHAFTPGKHFWHTEHAFGYRMTDMQAAVGIEQFKKAELFMKTRYANKKRYIDSGLNGFTKITYTGTPYSNEGHWVMPLMCLNNARRRECRKILAEHGIETRSFFQSLGQQSFLTKYKRSKCSNSVRYAEQGFYLPLYPDLKSWELQHIINVLKKIEAKNF